MGVLTEGECLPEGNPQRCTCVRYEKPTVHAATHPGIPAWCVIDSGCFTFELSVTAAVILRVYNCLEHRNRPTVHGPLEPFDVLVWFGEPTLVNCV